MSEVFHAGLRGFSLHSALFMLKELIMKKMIMAAAAACVLSVSGMAMAADLPAGWTATQDGDTTVISKASSGVSVAAKTIPAEGATAEAVAKQVAAEKKCTLEGLELTCPDKTHIMLEQTDANNISFIVIACGNADDATCQADGAEILGALMKQ